MLSRGSGTIIFSGATGSIRGGAGFAAFAAPKFGLRAVAQAMATRWTLPPLGKSPFHEARAALHEGREYRRRPWADIKMPNRRVTG